MLSSRECVTACSGFPLNPVYKLNIINLGTRHGNRTPRHRPRIFRKPVPRMTAPAMGTRPFSYTMRHAGGTHALGVGGLTRPARPDRKRVRLMSPSWIIMRLLSQERVVVCFGPARPSRI